MTDKKNRSRIRVKWFFDDYGAPCLDLVFDDWDDYNSENLDLYASLAEQAINGELLTREQYDIAYKVIEEDSSNDLQVGGKFKYKGIVYKAINISGTDESTKIPSVLGKNISNIGPKKCTIPIDKVYIINPR